MSEYIAPIATIMLVLSPLFIPIAVIIVHGFRPVIRRWRPTSDALSRHRDIRCVRCVTLNRWPKSDNCSPTGLRSKFEPRRIGLGHKASRVCRPWHDMTANTILLERVAPKLSATQR
jgi:hypothetical protein